MPLDLYEERQARLVRAILVDWSTGRIEAAAPDTFVGTVRRALGADAPIFGATEFDLANLHITKWQEHIARGAEADVAALRLVEAAAGTVTDLPGLHQLKRAISSMPTDAHLAVLRLDRPDEMIIERVGPGWELSRRGPGDDGYWVSPRLSLARAQSAIAAYHSGDLRLSTIDWRFEPDR